jgi:hypothetical protein
MSSDAGRHSDVEFVLIAEAGILEAQAVLLCESIRRFAGKWSRSHISVVSPRPNRRPSASTLRALERLDVEYVPIRVDSCCPTYGTTYRVHSVAQIERRPGPAIIVQLDSDTVFLGEPDFDLHENEAAARPVDVKGMCTTGSSDDRDDYWRAICLLAGVAYDALPMVVSTVDRQRVKASYNGGLIVARRSNALFTETEDLLRTIIDSGHRPWGAISPTHTTGTGTLGGTATVYWGTSQAAFSLVCATRQIPVRILPENHNVPLHLFGQLPVAPPLPLIHVHYHDMFRGSDALENHLLNGSIAIAPETAAWLKARLPLALPQ